MIIHGHEQNGTNVSPWTFIFPAEVNQGDDLPFCFITCDDLPFCFITYIVNKAMFLVVLYFLLVVFLFNMAHKYNSVPKHSWLGCTLWRKYVCYVAMFSCELQCSWLWVQC